MTPVLVLGGTGMLGHVLWRTCRDQGMEVFATVREERGLAPSVLDPSRTITGVSVEEPDSRRQGARQRRRPWRSIASGWSSSPPRRGPGGARPLQLALPPPARRRLPGRGARLIHISTDCVFAGDRGGYAEDDRPTRPTSTGARSCRRADGEGADLRTSMLGRELDRASGLLEWFLGAGGRRAAPRAVFSGPTTPVLARLIGDLIERHPGLEGLGTSARSRSRSSTCSPWSATRRARGRARAGRHRGGGPQPRFGRCARRQDGSLRAGTRWWRSLPRGRGEGDC